MNADTIIKQWGIALTGGVGTGKSTVASILKDLGYLCVDADLFAREVVSPGKKTLQDIVHVFGSSILQRDGTLDRKALGRIIFNDSTKKTALEKITHPAIENRLREWIVETGLLAAPRFFIYEAALIVEVGRHTTFRELWVTHCPFETQISRVMSRDQISRDQAIQVIHNQMPVGKKTAIADVVIETDEPRDLLRQHITTLALTRLGAPSRG